MVRSGRPDGTDGQQSLGELVAQAAEDISSLVRYEINLATKELKIDGLRILVAAASAIVGLCAICLIVILLCFALAYGLVDAFGIPIWAGFLCAVGACILLLLLAILTARWFIRKVTGMRMTRQTVMDDLGMLRRGEPSPNGSGPTVTNPGVSAGTGTKAEIPPARP